MTSEWTRRHVLVSGAASLGAMALPTWAFPPLAQGEEVVPFTDYPEDWKTERGPEHRFFDIRKIGPITPSEEFFTTQHYPHPQLDASTFRLKVTGLVDQEKEFSLDELRSMSQTEVVAGFECSGNSRRIMQGLVSNGRFQGVPLQTVLRNVGIKDNAREVVFFGADKGMEEVEFRGRKFEVEQQYGRSISVEKAMTPEPLIAYAMNGEPLTVHQGFPLRVLMPGWYGAPNVKWLANIHLQEDPYLGKYQANWYRTLRGEMIGGELMWKETAITRLRLKSIVARVTRQGQSSTHKVMGFVLSDGTPIRSVEVKIDDGAWQPATVDASLGKYAWKLFTYEWSGATPGEHTLVSRATDENGQVQPTVEDLETKKTFLEDNSQHPRTVMIG